MTVEVLARPPEAEWLAMRRKYSNGSSAAVHMREHEHMTIADWFVEKRTGYSQPQTRAMTRGKWLEEPVRAWYAAEHPDLGPLSPLNVLMRRDRLLVTPDSEFLDVNQGLELKGTPGSTSRRSRYWQCVAMLAVSEWDAVHLVELHAGDYVPTVLTRAEAADDIDRLMVAIARDWSYLDMGQPPPDAVFDTDQVFHVWPVPDVAKIDLPPRAAGLAHDLKQARARIKQAKKDEEEARDAIANLMVDGFSCAEVGMLDGEPLISWKANRPRHVVDAEALRRLVPDVIAQCTVEKPGARQMRVVGEPPEGVEPDVGF